MLTNCLNCGDRYHVRVQCTAEIPALDCTTPQLRPHVHVTCLKCRAVWFETIHQGAEFVMHRNEPLAYRRKPQH